MTVARSGPFEFGVVEAVPAGERRAGALLAEALGDGLTGAAPEEILRRWWSEAVSVLDACPSDRQELDIAPRAFSVATEGWRFHSSGAVMRFRVPRRVMAFRALLQALEDDVLPHRWIPHEAPWAHTSAIVGVLLERIGMPVDDAVIAIALELEVDVDARTRMGSAPEPTAVIRERHRERFARPLISAIESLPPQELHRAALDIASAPEWLAIGGGEDVDDPAPRPDTRAAELRSMAVRIRELRGSLERSELELGATERR